MRFCMLGFLVIPHNFVLTWVDGAVLIGYLVSICMIGAAFYRGQTDVGEYFVASRQIPSFVVVIGLAASLTSCISYLGIPSYSYRVNIIPLASILGAPLALWIVAKMFLPFFFKLEVLTCYEYLERRFGSPARLVAACLFLTSRLLWLVLVSYGSALALKFAIPVDVPPGIAAVLQSLHIDPVIGFWVLVIGVLGTTYTMLGGMRAVMWTDLLQFVMLCSGLGLILYVGISGSGLNLAEIWRQASDAGRTQFFNFAFNWTGDTFWAAMAGGMFLALSDQGLDQLATQRYLSAKSLEASQRSAALSLIVNVPFSMLLYAAGVILFVFYSRRPSPELNALMATNPDALLPVFFFDRMPHGVLGLMLATILAATMSCLTAGINSLSASSIIDIYAHYIAKGKNSEDLVSKGRWATVMWGTLLSIGAAYVGNLHSGIMEISYIFLGIAASLNLGIFLTAHADLLRRDQRALGRSCRRSDRLRSGCGGRIPLALVRLFRSRHHHAHVGNRRKIPAQTPPIQNRRPHLLDPAQTPLAQPRKDLTADAAHAPKCAGRVQLCRMRVKRAQLFKPTIQPAQRRRKKT